MFWPFLGRTKEVIHKLFHHGAYLIAGWISQLQPHVLFALFCELTWNLHQHSYCFWCYVLCSHIHLWGCYWQEDKYKDYSECLSDELFFFYWEERISGSLEKLPVTPNPSTLWLILHRGQLSYSRCNLSFKPATIFKVQEVTTEKALHHSV